MDVMRFAAITEKVDENDEEEKIPKKSMDIGNLWKRHAFYLITMSFFVWKLPELAENREWIYNFRKGPPIPLMKSIRRSSHTYTIVLKLLALAIGSSGLLQFYGIVTKKRNYIIPSILCFFVICVIQAVLVTVIDDSRYIIVNAMLLMANVITFRFIILSYSNNFELTFNCPAGVGCFWSYVFVKYISCLDMFMYIIVANLILVEAKVEGDEWDECLAFAGLHAILYLVDLNRLLTKRRYNTLTVVKQLYAVQFFSVLIIIVHLKQLPYFLQPSNNNLGISIHLTFRMLLILMFIDATFLQLERECKHFQLKRNTTYFPCRHLEERDSAVLMAIVDLLYGNEFQ